MRTFLIRFGMQPDFSDPSADKKNVIRVEYDGAKPVDMGLVMNYSDNCRYAGIELYDGTYLMGYCFCKKKNGVWYTRGFYCFTRFDSSPRVGEGFDYILAGAFRFVDGKLPEYIKAFADEIEKDIEE
jgi:hypothetical protein